MQTKIDNLTKENEALKRTIARLESDKAETLEAARKLQRSAQIADCQATELLNLILGTCPNE